MWHAGRTREMWGACRPVCGLPRNRGFGWEPIPVYGTGQDLGGRNRKSAGRTLLTDPDLVRERIERLAEAGEIETVTGEILEVSPDTICIHADTPDALELVRAVAGVLRRK
jgi:hypothetical protein